MCEVLAIRRHNIVEVLGTWVDGDAGVFALFAAVCSCDQKLERFTSYSPLEECILEQFVFAGEAQLIESVSLAFRITQLTARVQLTRPSYSTLDTVILAGSGRPDSCSEVCYQFIVSSRGINSIAEASSARHAYKFRPANDTLAVTR